MGSIMLPTTLATAGATAIIALWLAMRTGKARRAAKISIGDGGDPALICRMRAQANFVEYAPFILILIALIEFTTGPSTWLWVVSIAFLIARIAHPLGMDGLKGARAFGTAITFLLLLGLGLYAISLPILRQAREASAPASRKRSFHPELGPRLPETHAAMARSLTNILCWRSVREGAGKAMAGNEHRITAERPELFYDRLQ